ncbi:MAG: hypothetical protein ACI38Q_05375 [Candidatus Bruticola sp.]
MSKAKSFLSISLAAVALVIISLGTVWAAKPDQARQLIESLYAPKGVMPIRDLVIELECYDLASESNAFVLSSNDKIYFKAPNKLRIDAVINDPGGPMDKKEAIIIRDGINVWHYISMGQYPVKKALDQPSGTLNLPFNIQKYPIDANKKYTLKGKKNIDGVDTAEILIENPQDENDTKTVYVDTQRLVPLRLDAVRISDKQKILVRAEYKNIEKLADGRYFPKKIEIYENDVHKKMRVYKGLEVNCGLDDSMFNQMRGFVTP